MRHHRNPTIILIALVAAFAMLPWLHSSIGQAQPSNTGAGASQNPQAGAPGKPATNAGSAEAPQPAPSPAARKHKHKKHKHRLPMIPPVPPPSLL